MSLCVFLARLDELAREEHPDVVDVADAVGAVKAESVEAEAVEAEAVEAVAFEAAALKPVRIDVLACGQVTR